jgi:hypothetical protein
MGSEGTKSLYNVYKRKVSGHGTLHGININNQQKSSRVVQLVKKKAARQWISSIKSSFF